MKSSCGWIKACLISTMFCSGESTNYYLMIQQDEKCTQVHACMHTCLPIYIHIYMYTCMHKYIDTYIHAYMHSHACLIQTVRQILTHACLCKKVHTYLDVCIYMHLYIQTYIHNLMDVWLHTCICTYIHTWMLADACKLETDVQTSRQTLMFVCYNKPM